jgi:hypothetical protein
MKNKNIVHARQEVRIYSAYYKPSLNPWRFIKSILGLLFFGSCTVPNSYSSTKRIPK